MNEVKSVEEIALEAKITELEEVGDRLGESLLAHLAAGQYNTLLEKGEDVQILVALKDHPDKKAIGVALGDRLNRSDFGLADYGEDEIPVIAQVIWGGEGTVDKKRVIGKNEEGETTYVYTPKKGTVTKENTQYGKVFILPDGFHLKDIQLANEIFAEKRKQWLKTPKVKEKVEE